LVGKCRSASKQNWLQNITVAEVYVTTINLDLVFDLPTVLSKFSVDLGVTSKN